MCWNKFNLRQKNLETFKEFKEIVQVWEDKLEEIIPDVEHWKDRWKMINEKIRGIIQEAQHSRVFQ